MTPQASSQAIARFIMKADTQASNEGVCFFERGAKLISPINSPSIELKVIFELITSELFLIMFKTLRGDSVNSTSLDFFWLSLCKTIVVPNTELKPT